MATLILRPVASKGTVASTVPADTPVEDVYKLVNEEVADDAATYYSVTTQKYSESLFCLFTLPKGVKITTLNSVTLKVRGGGSSIFGHHVASYSDPNANIIFSNGVASGSQGYTTSSISFTDETELNTLLTLLENNDLGVTCWNNDMKSHTIRDSQIYFELDCEYEEVGAGPSIYFKQNGEWAELSGNVYQKANGEWLEADVSVLSGEFPVEEVTI